MAKKHIPNYTILLEENFGIDDRPYLGAPEVVEKILRESLARIMKLKERNLSGEEFDWKASVTKEAVDLQNIFYGRTAGFRYIPWNSVKRLGAELVKEVGGGPDDAVFRLALKLFGEELAIFSKYESRDEDINEAEFSREINEMITPYIYTLLGITNL